MSEMMSLSSELLDALASDNPMFATYVGLAGHDDRWPDLSPAGVATTRALLVSYLDRAAAVVPAVGDERLAQRVLVDELTAQVADIDSGDYLSDLNSTASPFQAIRNVLEIMDTSTSQGWDNIVRRLDTIHDVLDSYRRSLAEGLRIGQVAARRQVQAIVDQGGVTAGAESGFHQLTAAWDTFAADESNSAAADQRDRLDAAIARAKAAVATFTAWVADNLVAAAPEVDAVGRDRYVRAARRYLGTVIEPEATYRWGWDQVTLLWAHLEDVCRQIDPDAPTAEVITRLQNDPERCAATAEAFVAVMNDRQQRALSQLSGEHFDVPAEIREIDVKIAPPGGPLGAYYTGPNEDFTRRGTVWYSTGGRETFPLFEEITTAYHEGFPGHHLQVGVQMLQGDRLSRFHRLAVWYPGSGEGWALYAERFMYESGFLEKPDYVVGWLSAQLLRACRVAVDIGAHLDLPIPDDVDFHPGERWTFDLICELLQSKALQSADVAESEATRYLGWPGQAISYKVGEQALLDLRAELVDRGDVSLRDFHRRVLEVGSVGLDLLADLVRAA